MSAPAGAPETASRRSDGREMQPSQPNDNKREVSILLLTDAFLPHAGGSREYYYNLYREMVRQGLASVTVATKKVPGWKAFDQENVVESLRIRRIFKPLKSLKYAELPKAIFPFFQALWCLFRYKPEIIHAGDLYPPGVIAWLIYRVFGIPYIIYAHGEEITQADKYRYQPRVRDRIYRDAAAVIANSDFSTRQLLRIGVQEERIHKVTPGVDTERFRPGPPTTELIEKYGLEGKTVLLTVGRLVVRKGHRSVLQALAAIRNEFPEAHYLVGGIGPEETKLRELVDELGLQGRVTFTGLIPTEDLPAIYRLCDVMILANQHRSDGDVEGFGMVFLEANATGKPVIGGRSGGATEAVADHVTGFLVDPDRPAELVRALRILLGDPECRRQMGSAGRRRVETEFDWAGRARVLYDVNRSILKGSGPAWNDAGVGSTRVIEQG